MVSICANSAALAFPAVLRNVFRSEFASELPRLSRQRAPIISRRHPIRNFTSIPSHRFSTPSTLPSTSAQVSSEATSSTSQPSQTEPDTPKDVPIGDLTDTIDLSTTSTPHAKIKSTQRQSKSKPDRTSPSSTDCAAKKSTRKDSEPKGLGFTPKKKKRESWQIQKDALRKKFQEGWNPPKKLSPDAVEGIRHLNSVAPDRFTTPVLAEQFQVSPEAIRRILKSKWRASADELENRRKRWERRHERIWGHLSELGLRPKTKRSESFGGTNSVLYGDDHKGKK